MRQAAPRRCRYASGRARHDRLRSGGDTPLWRPTTRGVEVRCRSGWLILEAARIAAHLGEALERRGIAHLEEDVLYSHCILEIFGFRLFGPYVAGA